jgi:hypothetical protein
MTAPIPMRLLLEDGTEMSGRAFGELSPNLGDGKGQAAAA